MAERITNKLVKGLEPPKKGNRIVYDTEIKGFGIRITAAGSKAFVFNYRFDGTEKRATIGAYGRDEWSVAASRKQAGEWSRGLVKGIDPLAERERARAAAKGEREAATVSDLCDRYIEDHLPRKRPSSQRDDKAMIETIIRPRLGKEKIEHVQYTDIDKLHRGLKVTPYRANRVLALLSKMFNLGVRWRMRPDNPCKGVERFPESKRARYLSTTEIESLTRTLAGYKDQKAANIVRLCLLTGCRRGEALGATWEQFDLGHGVWTKPGATTKQGTEHRAPLSKGAVALLKGILAAVPRDASGELKSKYVFPGRLTNKPLSEIKTEWAEIAIAAGLYDVEKFKNTKGEEIEAKKVNCRLHDLRHTYASILASAGLSLPIIGALLGHTQPSTTSRYSHLIDDALRRATETVGAVVLGEDSAEIVPLHQDGAA